MKNIAVLGSTGTIGKMTLDVIRAYDKRLNVTALAANKNFELLGEQIQQFLPDRAVLLNAESCTKLKQVSETEIICGPSGLAELASSSSFDILVVAMTGTVALDAVLSALHGGKRVALATKEILVGFGQFVTEALREGNGEILPVDSEHNALHQCLEGRDFKTVKRLILTASGGPFLDKDYRGAAPSDVLAHPTWNMGSRITVDSATLMNKGFEVIEAHFLFGASPDMIDVVVHPHSVIHSLVEFKDASVLAQLAFPDMRLPIAYALLYPERGTDVVQNLDLTKIGSLEFSRPDFERFPCLRLAYQTLRKGGTAPAVLQAADYEAVGQFLSGKLSFERIGEMVASAIEAHSFISKPTIPQIREAERFAYEFIKQGV
ncbi:1-deoxy-D-xylulose-5-phosphate reductoisomerase [candidate division WOR-3 bacterium]|uniref:1-deoxy-D-xylulose 5-phosphate reductoisomerase n=1 Tax=candidate division WOR-3 bacterium TaxID=2052148 RepID=A0A9D5KB50_UNCW3|nr:1-deoxy-D-xylulose-5-phosphate reductoisomerase [candidate division WOR-3 bacterium]MBD3364521.1 1-deoxy-D-xylulose-5-phosphate reductoisomerase [candidate division WOR-3 bacterium]